MSPFRESYTWNMDEACTNAMKKGCEVIRGDDHTLLLDIDREADLRVYEALIKICGKKLHLREHSRWRSKSGKGWHVLLACGRTNARERVMLQAVLGSDRKRAVLGLMMLADGINDPNLLFKPNTNGECA